MAGRSLLKIYSLFKLRKAGRSTLNKGTLSTRAIIANISLLRHYRIFINWGFNNQQYIYGCKRLSRSRWNMQKCITGIMAGRYQFIVDYANSGCFLMGLLAAAVSLAAPELIGWFPKHGVYWRDGFRHGFI